MCNTCGCSNCGCHNGRNSNCGCNLCNEFANAINNLFADPNGCGCGCGCNNGCGNNRAWRNGFRSGWNARGNNNGCGCGCGCHRNRCGCNASHDLSGLTDCGNYDEYYARQYGLNRSGCCCSL